MYNKVYIFKTYFIYLKTINKLSLNLELKPINKIRIQTSNNKIQYQTKCILKLIYLKQLC